MRYRKVDPRIWNDEKFRKLSDDGQLSFFMLLTHPHMTAVGAMRGTLAGLASEKGWPIHRIEEAMKPAVDSGMVRIDEQASIIWLPKFLRYNEPEGPNAVKKAWPAALALLPECDLKDQVCQSLLAMFYGMSDGMREAIGYDMRDAIKHAMSHLACARVEQEQEQEQESDDPNASFSLKGSAEGKHGRLGISFTAEPHWKFTGITDREMELWQSAYPGLAIPLEIERAALWLKGDWPARRKIKWQAFLVGWFNRAQQRSRGGKPT